MKTLFFLFLFVLLGFGFLPALAAMPPDVYADQIKDSPVIVTAEVLSVEVTHENDWSVSKEVRFRLIQSYGQITPTETFVGHCLSVGKKPVVGPDQYYSPKKGDVVFLSLDDGNFTSYTLLTSELKAALEEGGLSAIEYGCGCVYLDDEKLEDDFFAEEFDDDFFSSNLSMVDPEPLHEAVKAGNLTEARRLLEEGADTEAKDEFASTPLSTAAGEGNLPLAELLLQYGAEVNAKGVFSNTPLHVAVTMGHFEVAELFLDRGADVEATDMISGQTPLLAAVEKGQVRMARLLLDRGADVDAKNLDGITPVYIAALSGSFEMVKLLLDRGADINERNDLAGYTLLHEAVHADDTNTVLLLLLLGRGADINATDGDEQTPLHVAAFGGDTGMVKLLISKGADLTAKNQIFMTARDWAEEQGHIEILQIIEEASLKKNRSLQEIAWDKNATYVSGDWKYVFTITAKGTRSEGRGGELFHQGLKVPDLPEKQKGDYYPTPWGNMIWNGRESSLWVPKGWLLHGMGYVQEIGKEIVP